MHFRAIMLTVLTVFIVEPKAFAKKVLKYSEDGAPSNFDPVQSATIYANKITTAVYHTLYEYKYLKVPYELKTNLAEAMPVVSKDGLTYTIKIRKGVKYKDDACFKNGKGREVVAQDFIYSIKRHFDPKNRSQGSWLWKGKILGIDKWKKSGAKYGKKVEGLQALDKYTIQIKLVKPYPQLIYTFAMGFSSVVPEESVKKYGRELSIKPVGSGPFYVASHTSKKTVLERNKNYVGKKFNAKEEGYDPKIHGASGIANLNGKTMPFVDRVEVNWVKELVARWNSFTKGNEIVWTMLQNQQISEVLETKHPVKLKKKFAAKYNFRVGREAGLVYNHFNMDNKKLGYHPNPKIAEKNKALRCAVRKAVNWRKRIDKFYLGIGDAYPGFIPPIVDGFDKTLPNDSVKLDIVGAKKLLKDAGWNAKNLPTIIYPGVSSVRTRQFFEDFRGNMSKIGYPKKKIKFKGYATFGDFNKDVKRRKTMLVPMGWGLDYPDAENTLGLFYGPNASPGSNASNYDNPQYDKLYAAASTMQPGLERTELYKKMNKIIIDDCVTVSSFSRTRVYLWHKNAIMWPQRDIINNIFKYSDIKK